VVAVFYPQTLFVGYFILDQLLAGKLTLALPLLLQLLGLKLLLSSFYLGSGMTGGGDPPCSYEPNR
jgi:H+/Cl- antiporter ClcA